MLILFMQDIIDIDYLYCFYLLNTYLSDSEVTLLLTILTLV